MRRTDTSCCTIPMEITVAVKKKETEQKNDTFTFGCLCIINVASYRREEFAIASPHNLPLCSGCEVNRLSRRNADLVLSFSCSDCMPRISTEKPSCDKNAWSAASCSRTRPKVRTSSGLSALQSGIAIMMFLLLEMYCKSLSVLWPMQHIYCHQSIDLNTHMIQHKELLHGQWDAGLNLSAAVVLAVSQC